MSRSLVVIPTYNEALNIEQLVTELLAVDEGIDILVADDASPDGTGALVEGLGARHPGRVSVLHRSGKGGRGAAVLAGLKQGLADERYARLVEMDADLSHLPEELPSLLAASENADLVIGSRYGQGSRIIGWSRKRKLWSRMSNRLLRTVLRLPTRDYTNGFRVYSRPAASVLATAELRERGYISLSEWAWVLHHAGMRFADVPTTFVNRRQGVSKMGTGEALSALRALVRLRGTRPKHTEGRS
ncbi:MAG: polyprenol monophosphomannose synthase [Chloroflexota bacterium]|nr:polyprenol monophosphomannose synthase [Chloroflexota bacterium]